MYKLSCRKCDMLNEQQTGQGLNQGQLPLLLRRDGEEGTGILIGSPFVMLIMFVIDFILSYVFHSYSCFKINLKTSS